MTGQQYQDRAVVRLRESQSTVAAQQSMLYPDHIIQTANELAEDTWALYRNAVIDIVSGQVEYIMPERPFRIMGVSANDGNGNVYPLAATTPEQADNSFFNWRATDLAANYQGVPQYYVDDGSNTLKLLPVPNYGAQDGLIVSGYYSIGKWWDLALPCPLPSNYDEAIIAGVCMRRCEEMIGVDTVYAQVLPIYEKRFKEQKRRLYRESVGKVAARRNSIPSMGKSLGAWGGGWAFFGGD